jgi:hypothetical protein
VSDVVQCPGCAREIERDDHLLCPSCHSDLTTAFAPSQPTSWERATPEPTSTAASWRCLGAGCRDAPPLDATVEQCPFCFELRPNPPTLLDGHDRFELRDESGGIVVPLVGPGPWRLGREELDSPQLCGYMTVSRSHALVFRRAENLVIRDLGSSNHTFIGQVALRGDEERIIGPGSAIGLGKGVVLRVQPG